MVQALLQQLDAIFNMAVDLTKPAFNYETKYRVTMLTREEWTRGTGTPPAIKVLVWFTDGSRMEGTGAGVYGKSVGRRVRVSLGMYATVFKLRYMLSWNMLMKFNFMVDQRSTLVSDLTARRLWKFYRPRERLHWLNSVKRH
jgi:hypothetical protein